MGAMRVARGRVVRNYLGGREKGGYFRQGNNINKGHGVEPSVRWSQDGEIVGL